MKHFGIVGFPLSHSYSPGYFNKKFKTQNIDADYSMCEVENPELLLQCPIQKNWDGFNVTIPYKIKIIPLLSHLDNEAGIIGAVNCVKKVNGKFIGYNTDVYGFEKSLLEVMKQPHNKALVMGAGGASLAVKFVLQKLKIGFSHVSRNPGKGDILWQRVDADVVAQHTLIINCTPIGMSPNEKTYPLIPYHAITPKHLLYDMVYNPAETVFIKKGKQQGATTCNGLRMFELQAQKSWEIWNS